MPRIKETAENQVQVLAWDTQRLRECHWAAGRRLSSNAARGLGVLMLAAVQSYIKDVLVFKKHTEGTHGSEAIRTFTRRQTGGGRGLSSADRTSADGQPLAVRGCSPRSMFGACRRKTQSKPKVLEKPRGACRPSGQGRALCPVAAPCGCQLTRVWEQVQDAGGGEVKGMGWHSRSSS